MWDKIVKYLQLFPNAVVTTVDIHGYPVSILCQPHLDSEAQVLRFFVPADIELQTGSATLLCHSHDEKLWNLKSVTVIGTLAVDGDDWVFHPTRLLPGMGLNGPFAMIQMIRSSQKAARRYLQKRHLSTPVIDWDKLKTL